MASKKPQFTVTGASRSEATVAELSTELPPLDKPLDMEWKDTFYASSAIDYFHDSSFKVILPGYGSYADSTGTLFGAKALVGALFTELQRNVEMRIIGRKRKTYLVNEAPAILTNGELSLATLHTFGDSKFTQIAPDIFELRSIRFGASTLASKRATVDVAYKKKRILRFVYRDPDSGVSYTRRVAVTKLRNWDSVNPGFSSNNAAKNGERYRNYNLDKASYVLVEKVPIRKLHPQTVVEFKLHQGKLTAHLSSLETWAPPKPEPEVESDVPEEEVLTPPLRPLGSGLAARLRRALT